MKHRSIHFKSLFELKLLTMPCNHKFLEYLSLERLYYFSPEIVIVGTFNPEWPTENYAEWFYGRTENNFFWDLLPRMFSDPGMRRLNHYAWKNYCVQKKVAITDLLLRIEDADENAKRHRLILSEYSDTAISKRFHLHVPNNVILALRAHQSIQAVYLTTTHESILWDKLWRPIAKYCEKNGIWCQRLMTPSKGARYGATKQSSIAAIDTIYNDWRSKWRLGRNTMSE